MFASILAALKWYYSFGTKFLRVAPFATTLVVILTVVSQISLLLAFFLPLKVILLLGAPETPNYFPDILRSLDRTPLILMLSISAAGFYLLYVLSERVISFFTNRGASKLLAKSKKITLFENQQEVAAKGYQRYARCLAGLFFVGLVFIILAFIHPAILLLILGYIFFTFCFINLIFKFNPIVKEILKKDYGGVVNALAAIGFLVSFGFIVFQFVMGMTVGLLIAVISLLLSRQVYNRLASFITDVGVLYSQRVKLNALFFHGQVLLKDDQFKDSSFWELFNPADRNRWIKQAVDSLLAIEYTTFTTQWFQSGVADVVAYTVSFDDGKANYLLKLFNRNRESVASHEATLLTEISGIPSLPLVALGDVNGFRCHIHTLPEVKKIPARHVKSKSWDVMTRMAGITLPTALIERYGRSKPYIWQRINAHMAERLAFAVTDQRTSDLVEAFGKRLMEIQNQLQSSPLVVVNPDLNVDTLLITNEGSIAVAHWGRWSIEPMGFGWPIQENAQNVIIESVMRENDLPVSSPDVLKLAAVMAVFERFYVRQQYQSAIDLLPEIFSCLSSTSNGSITS